MDTGLTASQTAKKLKLDCKNLSEAEETLGSLPASVLIISNDFEREVESNKIHLVKRQGAKKDCESMEALFSSIVGSEKVVVRKDVNEKSMNTIIEGFKKSCLSEEFCVVIFMSYGIYSDTLYHSDGKPLNLYQDLVYRFNCNHFKEFGNKPRIFLIQSCGVEKGAHESLRERIEQPGKEKGIKVKKYESNVRNIFLGKSSIPHFMPRASTEEGTHYIQAIKKVFETDQNWRKEDLVTLHKKVQSEVLRKYQQTPYHIEFNCDQLIFLSPQLD